MIIKISSLFMLELASYTITASRSLFFKLYCCEGLFVLKKTAKGHF